MTKTSNTNIDSFDVKTHLFPNGFRLIHQLSASDLPMSYIRIFCDVGSAYECDKTHGSSHFIEHMIYKGTKLHKDRKKIFLEFDKIGAEINATTDKRYTFYQIDCLDEYVFSCVNIMSDMLLHSTFDHVEYKKERLVVIEENIQDINDTMRYIYDKMDEMIYAGTSYSHPIDSDIYHEKNDLQYDTILDIYHQFYHVDRMTISMITNKPFESAVRMLNKTFFVKNKLPSSPKYSIKKTLESQTDIKYCIESRVGEKSSYLALGFRTSNFYSKDKHILYFLSCILSGPMSSRIFMLLREDNALAYSTDVNVDFNDVAGEIVIYAVSDPDKILTKGKTKGVLPLIIELLNELLENGVHENEIEKIKGYLRGSMLTNNEDGGFLAEFNGEEYLYRKDDPTGITPYNKIYESFLENITKSQIDTIIRKYFRKDKMSLCLISEKVPKQKKIAEECEKLSG
jgi:predicted Zn-dependent peptidase